MDDQFLPHQELDPTGFGFAQAAKRSGLAVDGLRLVSDALAYASQFVEGTPAGEHLRGWQLCVAVARYAEELFGAEADEVLREWGLVTTEDIGRAVVALVEEGLMQASAEDSLADFASRGSLADLMKGSA